MRGLLLEGLVVASVGAGLLLLATCRRGTGARLARGLALTIACLSLLLLPQAGQSPSVYSPWIPVTGKIGLDLGVPGVYLAVAVFWGLALTLLVPRTDHPPPGRLANYWPGLAFLSCGLVVTALTLSDFLARYVILELVALCVILVFLLHAPSRRDGFPAWRWYLQFRLGDAGLMLAILLLERFSGTFDIKSMLSGAAAAPLGQRVPIALGGLLAAWVKMALPPFHGWLLDTGALSWEKRTWLAGIAPPILGAYLLYRLSPVLLGLPAARILLSAGGVAILLWLFVSKPTRQLWRGATPWLIGHSAASLVLAGTPLMSAYLLTFVPARYALCALTARARTGREATYPQDRTGQLAPFGWLLGLTNWAERPGRCDLESINRGVSRAVVSLWRVAAGVAEARVLEGINRGAARAVVSFSRVTAVVAEARALEGMNRGAARLARHLGRTTQKTHTGRLRRNLLWASLGLLGLLIMALSLSD